ncbi:MAG: serine hydrolase domain-containing protein [Phycisphaeraceae bacterium]
MTVAAAALLLCGQALASANRYADVLVPIGGFVDDRVFVTGAGLRVVERGSVAVDTYWGNYGPDTSVRIASATKWLSAAAILSVVDDGLIDLDAPVSQYLPTEFAGQPTKGQMTVRQMFSHTSGLPGGSSYEGDLSLTLAESVALIAVNEPLEALPGSQFTYGGVSMHVAGRVAEVVTGQSWSALFEARIAGPLGMTATDYFGLGVTQNPRIAGGARSSVNDYSRFLEMLLAGGVNANGERVLSQQAVDELLSEQTAGATLNSAPPSVTNYDGYALGSWIDGRGPQGAAAELSSPGLFGAVPWLHRDNGVYGFFLIDNLLSNVLPLVDDVRAVSRSPLPGDTDGDRDIDDTDLGTLFSHYTGPVGAAGGKTLAQGDTDGDGDIDDTDLGTAFSHYTGPLTPATVPEPVSSALLVLLACLSRRCRGLGRQPHARLHEAG